MIYDVIVVGCGITGSSTLYQLAKQKKSLKVLGLEQFQLAHTLGSSHGESRITRLSNGEGKEYTILAQQSQNILQDLAHETGERFGKLYYSVGGIVIGPAAKTSNQNIHGINGFLQETINSAQQFNISHQLFDNVSLRKRFSQFNVDDNDVAYYEPTAGYLCAEQCLEAMQATTIAQGIAIHSQEKMLSFSRLPNNNIQVITQHGSYETTKLILSVGPWVNELLTAAQQALFNLKIYRQKLFWFALESAALKKFSPENFPVFIWDVEEKGIFYGFPSLDGMSIKIATEEYLEPTTPQLVNRVVSAKDIITMYQDYVEPYIKGVKANCVRAEVCLYTVAPQWQFVIDYLPDFNKRIILVSPCSGHGFKHAPAIGEALAAIVLDQTPRIDVMSLFKAALV